MREAFEAYCKDTYPENYKSVIAGREAFDAALWIGFRAGAAFAARECDEIVRCLPANRDGMLAAIREAFPEAFK